MSKYQENIRSRNAFRYMSGLLVRVIIYIKFEIIRRIALIRGASIGKNSNLTLSLALKANKNLVVGYSSIIETDQIDLRDKVIIGNKVIVNKGVQIIRVSHNAHSSIFETISNPLTIQDFCWITSNALILPNCLKINKGSILGAGTVVAIKEIPERGIVVGNPAIIKRKRGDIHTDLIVESLQGRDLIEYIKIRLKK